MKKNELIEKMSAKSGLTKKDSEAALNAFIETISDAMSVDEKVSLVGFGTFEVRQRAERNGVNPKTGEPMLIKASKSPAFKASKTLKEACM